MSSDWAVWDWLGENCTSFRARRSSVVLRAVRETPELPSFTRERLGGHRMRPYPWSSPGNLLFLLPDMVMWHLQQVAPIRSGHSVTVTPPEVQIPCDIATEPTPKITTISLSDLYLSGLIYFPRIWENVRKRSHSFYLLYTLKLYLM